MVTPCAMGKKVTDEELRWQAEVGRRLALLLDAVDLSATTVATSIGLDQQTFSTYVTGRSKLPGSVAAKLWRKFGASSDWIFDGDEKQNTDDFNAKLLDTMKKGPQKPKRGRKPKLAR